MKNIMNDFIFLGFDVRKIKNTEFANQMGFKEVISIDLAISERPSTLNAFNWDNVGKTETVFGFCLEYEVALKHLDSLYDKSKDYAIIGVFIEKESLKDLDTEEYANSEIINKLIKQQNHLDEFAGFEVATIDFEWISALFNFDLQLKEILPEHSLNNLNLINDVQNSNVLKEYMKKKIPEHEPYGIWGLWRTK